MANTIRILIADDHPILRAGLRELIDSEPGLEMAGEASNGREAVRLAQELKPDVILMDLIMPDMSGVEAIQEIKKILPQMRILVLSSFSEEDQIRKAVRSGALGYILKIANPQELVRAIWKVAKGEPVFTDSLMLDVFTEEAKPEFLENEQPTARELQLLKLLGQGLTNKEIATRMFISENSVKIYVTRLLRKFHLENRTQAALLAIRLGVIDPP
jgi:DNA-binding NarL/FixJ family response regulator